MGVIGYLNVAMFLGCAGVAHPFRGFSTSSLSSACFAVLILRLELTPLCASMVVAPGLLIIIAATILILFPIVLKEGFFELFGAVNIFICYAATFTGSF